MIIELCVIQKCLGVSVCILKTNQGSYYARAKTHIDALNDCFNTARLDSFGLLNNK